jgi:hypothetical protein
MRNWVTGAGMIAAALSLAGNAFGQGEDKEPAAIVEIGGAGDWGLRGGSSLGPTIAAEVTPIENWLELESGVTTLFSHGQTEWDADFLFKKPYTLSDTVEFMFGVGPEWTHTITEGKTVDSIAGEAALDFMFWPWANRKYGLYLEPSYDYGFGRGHEQSLGISGGLLIPVP